MNAVGLVVEYNPFHNGHAYHLQQSGTQSKADAVVAVMSGPFLQRGEPAVTDKWRRTRMALAGGCDLVLELPFIFACNSAPHFSDGAIRTLQALGGVTHVCFGSESGDLAALKAGAAFLHQHRQALTQACKAALRRGETYPTARQSYARQFAGETVAQLLSTPNNILGLEYLRAIEEWAPTMTPLTIRRIGAQYHQQQACGDIASATGIRHRLDQGQSICGLVPPATDKILKQAREQSEVIDSARLEAALLVTIQKGTEALAEGYQVSTGLAERLTKAALRVTTLDELIDFVKTRQITQTRMQRILLYQLMGLTATTASSLLEGPAYLRVLGMTSRGQAFLSAHRKERQLPLVTNLSRVYPLLKRFWGRDNPDYRRAEQMLSFDLKATRLYTTLLNAPPPGPLNQDFFRSVCRL